MSGLFALGGALVGGLASYFVQKTVQRNENFRHARKIAFDSAIVAWRTQIDSSEGNSEDVQPLQDYIVSYLVFADVALNSLSAKSTIKDFERILRTTRDHARFLRKYRDELIKEPLV
jgi:hypothetical protein